MVAHLSTSSERRVTALVCKMLLLVRHNEVITSNTDICPLTYIFMCKDIAERHVDNRYILDLIKETHFRDQLLYSLFTFYCS